MRKIISVIITSVILLMTAISYAEDNKLPEQHTTPEKITLYQQPNVKSVTTSAIETSRPIIPIFTQGEWTKVADPSNGNVGWVQNEILKKQGLPTVKTTMQSVRSSDGSGYKLMESFSGGKPIDQKQMDELLQKWQVKREQMQKVFNQVLQENAKTLGALAKELQDPNLQIPLLLPVLQPVVIIPNKAEGFVAKPVSAKEETSSK
jgi:hypothetical protein